MRQDACYELHVEAYQWFSMKAAFFLVHGVDFPIAFRVFVEFGTPDYRRLYVQRAIPFPPGFYSRLFFCLLFAMR